MSRSPHSAHTRQTTQTPEQRTLALRFKARRRALGLPGWRVATLAGLSPNALVNYELGRQRLAADKLARLDETLRAFETLAAQARQDAQAQAERLAAARATLAVVEGRRAG